MAINVDSAADEAGSEALSGRLWQRHGQGHPVGWYVVALSESVQMGDVLGVDLCDGRIVVYRGEDDVVHAMTPYCPHMGADLSVGAVMGNALRCPFHHWEFGAQGVCTKIPTGDRITASARVASLRTSEQWGMVWVYWGLGDPLYPIPSFPSWNDADWVWRAFRVPLQEIGKKALVEPWALTANGVDFQHFRAVHNVDLDPEVHFSDIGLEWQHTLARPETSGEIDMHFQTFGMSNLLTSNNHGGDISMCIAVASPMGDSGTQFFMCVTTRHGPSAEQRLTELQQLHTEVLYEDLPVMNTLRFGDDHLVASDRNLSRFLREYRDWPKVTMAEIEAAGRGLSKSSATASA